MQKIGEKTIEFFGTFEFFLDENGTQAKLICTLGDKKAETTYVGKVQGQKAMSISSMNLTQNGKTVYYIGLPDNIYDTFQSAKSNFAIRHIHLQYAGTSAETGLKWYSLSAEVPRDTWKKIAKYFLKFDSDEEDSFDGELKGWLTAQPDTIETILDVRGELTLAYRRVQAKKAREDAEQKGKELQGKLNDIDTAFENATYPDPKIEDPKEAAKFQPGYEKIYVEGEKIENPEHPENIYGGGQWWIIQKNWIWKIQNNGHDGDDWSMNNVNTGGAGAIGVRVPYSEELAQKIRSL